MVTVSTRPEPGSKVVLEIEVPAAEVDRHVADAYRTLARQTRVPGFRPGKAPRAVIDRYVGRGSVLAEAIEHLVGHSYEEALEQAQVVPIDQPELDVDPSAIREGEPVRFSATVSVRPEVELGAYTDYPFSLETPEVTDAQIEAVLEELRDQQGSLRPVEGRAAQKGDYANVRMAGFVDGEPFAGGQSDRMPVILGEDRLIPGFEDNLVGMAVDEERSFDLTFPDDYAEESLRGKQARFEVKLLDLREKQLPDLDDAFAQSVSESQTMDALRVELRIAMEARAVQEGRHNYADRIVEFATANASVEIPEVMVRNEAELMRDELRSRLARQRIGIEQYLEVMKQSPEELLEEFREPATRRVKTLLVLSAIAEKEGVDVAPEEIDEEIAEQLERAGGAPQIAEYLRSVRGRAYLRMTLRNRKLVETLVERALGSEATDDAAKPAANDQPQTDEEAAPAAGTE